MPSPTELDVITNPFSSYRSTDQKKRHVIDLAAFTCQQTNPVAQLYLLDDVAFSAFEQAIEANPARNNVCLCQLKIRRKRWS
ncbi:hypothetical protein PS718_03803 [Pseudomonas fluorescens]|uniref:Uncharacterized protein n=1 Tax=Pseudomonas fluorescens TaxID=294 RepID=A0A5E7DEM2_PSEFL|nr:hypothetical protein PS718_03803 [Pseudomonas fluorescens]